jgi:nitroreductase
MNQVIDNILMRRSVRKYKMQPIPEDALLEILKAGSFAPSGMNAQSWHFTVIQNKEKLESLEKTVYSALNQSSDEQLRRMGSIEDFHYFYEAPVLVIVSNAANSISASPVSDAALAIGNMFLAAHSLGIGSCWIHILTRLREVPEVKQALADLGVPSGYVVCGGTTLGYQDGPEPEAAPRREGTINFVR